MDRLSIIWDDVVDIGDRIHKLVSGDEVYVGIDNFETIIKVDSKIKVFTVDNIVVIKYGTGSILINTITQELREYPGLYYIPYLNMGDTLILVSRGHGGVDSILAIYKDSLLERTILKSSTHFITEDDKLKYREWNKGKQSEFKEMV